MIYIGDNQPTIYLGDNEPTIYLGDNQVYPMGPFVGIKMSHAASMIDASPQGSSQTVSSVIKVKCDVNYELLKDTGATWLVLSQYSGVSGKTDITLSAFSETTGTYETVITAMTTDSAYSATCIVSFNRPEILFADFVFAQNNVWAASGAIVTNQFINSNTAIRLKYDIQSTMDPYNDRIVGLYPGDVAVNGDVVTDSSDYRLFWYGGGPLTYGYITPYDVGSKRTGTTFSTYWYTNVNGSYDITLGDYYMFNNKNGTYKWNNAARGGYLTNAYLKVDVTAIKLKSLEVTENGVTLFNGLAAYDGIHCGLFDTISNQMFYNADVPMSYELNGTVYNV